jgi:hypothetical protein
MNRLFLLSCLLAAQLFSAQIPAGSELSIRLTDKVASEAQTQPAAISVFQS